jgi:hypothetical protein
LSGGVPKIIEILWNPFNGEMRVEKEGVFQ